MATTEGKLVPIQLKPGLDRSSTAYAGEGAWYDCDRIRWRDGYPETMRGRQTFTVSTFIGAARNIMSWNLNDGTKIIGFGTECKLYVNYGSTNYDITPVRTSVSIANGLNTTLDSRTIVVSSPAHGLTAGDYVIFTSMAATVGGNVYLTSTEYEVSVPSANSFSFTYAASAAATSTGTGSFNADYLLPCCPSISTGGTGYGTGPYGSGTYGTARTDVSIFSRKWSLDNWGEDLIASPLGGRIYLWDASNGLNTRAVLVTASPSANDVVLISEEAKHLLTFGCNDQSGVFTPNLLRWSTSENYNTFESSITNTAGDLPLADSNRFIGALRTKGAILAWGESTLHEITYVGGNFVFKNRKLGDDCGLVGPGAAIDVDDTVFWLANDNFFTYDGRVSVLNCPLIRDILGMVNEDQIDKACAFSNGEFSEVGWLVPTSTNDNTFYIIHNRKEQTWYWGNYPYSFIHESPIYKSLIGGFSGSLAYVEPTSVYSDDGAAYDAYVSSAPFDLGDGDEILFVDRMIPNFIFNSGGGVNMSMTFMRYPNLTGTTKGPYAITSTTSKIDLRGRGRHATLRFNSSTAGNYWRSGKNRINVKPDGRR